MRILRFLLLFLAATTLALAQPAWKNQTVRVAWKDNSTDETAFIIERSFDGITFSYLARVGPNVVVYYDRGLSPRRYYYRVKAVSANGITTSTNVAAVTVYR